MSPVTPNEPDVPGSDVSPYPGLRDQVRNNIHDGMPSYATIPYGLIRQEQLSDQILTQTGNIFYVRWINVPGGKNITYFAVPATIAAYRDGATAPDTIGNGRVTSDIDQNGNFTLQTAPATSLAVSYGYQLVQDGDIDNYLDQARSWVGGFQDFTTLDTVPDGLSPAVVLYACHLACNAIARQFRFPAVKAGDASESLQEVAAGWSTDAQRFLADALSLRKSYWSSADQPQLPAAAIVSMTYPNVQPIR